MVWNRDEDGTITNPDLVQTKTPLGSSGLVPPEYFNTPTQLDRIEGMLLKLLEPKPIESAWQK